MHLYIGSYTKGRSDSGNVPGAGITHAMFDPTAGRITKVAEYAEATNPSWVHVDVDGRYLYTASENSDGPCEVHSYEISSDGSLSHLSQQSSQDQATCHLTTTADRLFAASYGGGCLTSYPLSDGVIQPCDQRVDYEGDGPNKARQESAHAHQATTSPDMRWLYVCDLGTDQIHLHSTTTVSNMPVTSFDVPAGAGPRHLVFHPSLPLLYVWCELEPLLIEMGWDSSSGSIQTRRVHNLRDYAGDLSIGDGAAIHLHPSGRWLGVSERVGHTVCLFLLADDGSALWTGRGASAGKSPRDFAFTPDGGWLLVAYQDTHEVAVFAVDDRGGMSLMPEVHFNTGQPVCICMIGG